MTSQSTAATVIPAGHGARRARSPARRQGVNGSVSRVTMAITGLQRTDEEDMGLACCVIGPYAVSTANNGRQGDG